MPAPPEAYFSIFSTVVDLTKLGFIGVGVSVMLLTFVLLFRNKPSNENTLRFYNNFLVWGFCFAIFCGSISVFSKYLDQQKTSRTTITLTFVPDFATQNLPDPRIKLATGKLAKPDQPFVFEGGMINIGVEEAMKQFVALQKISANLSEDNLNKQKQIDALSQLTTKEPDAFSEFSADTKLSAELSSKLNESLRDGDYISAFNTSEKLRSITRKETLAILNAEKSIQ
jgi:hypothetical protein